jgi:O-acetyl-ADP-ribose deacetylase (regulator of RNase III)
MAEKLGCKSVSIPAISSGIFGFPKPLCAKTFYEAIEKYCTDVAEGCLEDVRLTNFDKETTDIFFEEFERVFAETNAPLKENT